MQEIEGEVVKDNEFELSVQNYSAIGVIVIYTSAAEGSHRLNARLLA